MQAGHQHSVGSRAGRAGEGRKIRNESESRLQFVRDLTASAESQRLLAHLATRFERSQLAKTHRDVRFEIVRRE